MHQLGMYDSPLSLMCTTHPLTPYSPDPNTIEASCANQLGMYNSPLSLMCTTHPEPYMRTQTSYSHLSLHIQT